MTDREIRAALNHHWAASDANDFELEHQIYREDAVLEYPQSGERIRGRLLGLPFRLTGCGFAMTFSFKALSFLTPNIC